MSPGLLRQRAEDDAALVVGLALDLPLDAEDVLAAESYHRVAYVIKQKASPIRKNKKKRR